MKRYILFPLLLLPFLVLGQQKAEKIYDDDVDVPAEFVGGTIALMKWLSYLKQSVVIDVNTPKPHSIAYKLTIEKTGQISNVESTCYSPNQNDLRYMNACYKMPKWKPAQRKGRKVRSKIILVVDCSGVVED